VAALAGEYDEASTRANAAETQFLAVGDDRQRWLARIHRVLADVARLRTVDLTAVTDIAAWGTADGDLGYALGLGILLSRAGRRWMVRDAAYEQATRCAKLAEQLFCAANAPLAAAQALGDQAGAHQAIHDRAAAIAAMDRADALLASLGNRTVLGSAIPVRRILLQHNAWALADTTHDADEMERLAAKLALAKVDLRSDDASLAAGTLVDQDLDSTKTFAPAYPSSRSAAAMTASAPSWSPSR